MPSRELAGAKKAIKFQEGGVVKEESPALDSEESVKKAIESCNDFITSHGGRLPLAPKPAASTKASNAWTEDTIDRRTGIEIAESIRMKLVGLTYDDNPIVTSQSGGGGLGKDYVTFYLNRTTPLFAISKTQNDVAKDCFKFDPRTNAPIGMKGDQASLLELEKEVGRISGVRAVQSAIDLTQTEEEYSFASPKNAPASVLHLSGPQQARAAMKLQQDSTVAKDPADFLRGSGGGGGRGGATPS